MDTHTHELVPDHTVLDEATLEDVLEEYNIDRTDLPKIQQSDAALPSSAESGDVVKITRDSRTTDRAVVYRLVIE